MTSKTRYLGNVLSVFLLINIGIIVFIIANITAAMIFESGIIHMIFDLLFLCTIIYVILFLIWIFQVHRNLQEMDSTYPVTPGGALASVLVPFYNVYGLWHVYSTMANYFQEGSSTENVGLKLAKYIPVYYIFTLGTVIVGIFLQDVDVVSLWWIILYLANVVLTAIYILITKVVSIGVVQLRTR